jgi:hypothetical protein
MVGEAISANFPHLFHIAVTRLASQDLRAAPLQPLPVERGIGTPSNTVHTGVEKMWKQRKAARSRPSFRMLAGDAALTNQSRKTYILLCMGRFPLWVGSD